ncbi:MAG: 30S ribosomal protein S3 [Candidatus Niyogibacteria bacterium]|nr:30S ribosomal protein S3 [Candidatus Niyogibacteria bacterium]
MTHTVHPYAYRLQTIRDWKSRWGRTKQYKQFLKASVVVREWLETRLRGMFVDEIDIECSPNLFSLAIRTSRPGVIIGKGGEGIEKLKKELAKKLARLKLGEFKEIRVAVEEAKFPESRSRIIAQMVAESLEKRLPFRRVMKQVIERSMASREVKGIKVALNGRLGGADMSRSEWLREGQIPLQTLRADIDFAKEKAHMPYGDIGIKVWIYRGEVFSDNQGAQRL